MVSETSGDRSVINELMEQSYADLVNRYRIAAFVKRVGDPGFKKYLTHGHRK
jgi:hypothetical protein